MLMWDGVPTLFSVVITRPIMVMAMAPTSPVPLRRLITTAMSSVWRLVQPWLQFSRSRTRLSQLNKRAHIHHVIYESKFILLERRLYVLCI